MADTFADLKTRIADELARTDLTSQIELAVLNAVAHHQRERFWFNEVYGATFSTVASQAWYAAAALADIPYIVEIDSLTITVSATVYQLTRRTYDEIEAMDVGGTYGDPTDYCYFNQQIRLFPVPNLVRTCSLSYHKRLTALSGSSDSNAWTIKADAEELIRQRAKADLFANVIRNFEAADRAERAEAIALMRLREETTRRVSSGRVTATQF